MPANSAFVPGPGKASSKTGPPLKTGGAGKRIRERPTPTPDRPDPLPVSNISRIEWRTGSFALGANISST